MAQPLLHRTGLVQPDPSPCLGRPLVSSFEINTNWRAGGGRSASPVWRGGGFYPRSSLYHSHSREISMWIGLYARFSFSCTSPLPGLSGYETASGSRLFPPGWSVSFFGEDGAAPSGQQKSICDHFGIDRRVLFRGVGRLGKDYRYRIRGIKPLPQFAPQLFRKTSLRGSADVSALSLHLSCRRSGRASGAVSLKVTLAVIKEVT